MKPKHFTPIVALVLMTLTLTGTTWAQSYKEVINAQPPAVYPGSPFTADTASNLYTAVGNGGLSQCFFFGCGAIYQWKPGARRQPTMLYSFSGTTDGAGPGGKLVFDGQGNLYGAAGFAGDLTACFQQGCGVVYKLTPTSSGFWAQTVLHTFEGGTDGITPLSVVVDGNGNIFGLTRDGGGFSCSGGLQCGTVFELSPTSSGEWNETILHTFTGGSDGGNPLGSLTFDAHGNLFGTTAAGGVVSTICTAGCGTVFELSLTSGGWTFNTIYNFNYSHGVEPVGSLVIDASGNLFGATYGGAKEFSYCPGGCGVVFELSPTASGWKQSLLHSFSGPDGANVQGGLTLDASGNIFGTTTTGGNPRCTEGFTVGCGVVFELSPASGGHWIYDHLYVFQGYDGYNPNGNPLVDAAGNIFGTTVAGGTGFGNMYELSPKTH
jgi:hypothetical protein